MCLSGATCLPEDCCYSKLALRNPTKRVDLVQSRYHHLIEILPVLTMIKLRNCSTITHSLFKYLLCDCSFPITVLYNRSLFKYLLCDCSFPITVLYNRSLFKYLLCDCSFPITVLNNRLLSVLNFCFCELSFSKMSSGNCKKTKIPWVTFNRQRFIGLYIYQTNIFICLEILSNKPKKLPTKTPLWIV